MVFRTTFTTKSLSRRSCAGLSLVELMVAVSIGALLMAGLASLLYYSGRSFAAMANYIDLDAQSKVALDLMTKEIRQANRLIAATNTSITLEDSNKNPIQYTYDSSTKTLTRYTNGVADALPLLKQCEAIQFSIFQRNPISGTYDQYAVAVPGTCKLVQLYWICSRKTIGTLINTESVQSAKIVIRKQ
jgi:prepilin-type N-terminal cleavage/methylation domain-containing protein